MKFKFSGQIFFKKIHIRFHENTSSGSRVVPCGQKEGQTDRHMTKLIGTFRNFADAAKQLSTYMQRVVFFLRFHLSTSTISLKSIKYLGFMLETVFYVRYELKFCT